MFCDNLRNILGGCKEENQAILHVQHVRRVLEILDPKGKDVEPIARNGGIDVWKIWAKPLLDAKECRPGTVKAYLASLAKFCEFIVDQEKNKVSGFPTIEDSQLQALNNVSSRFRAMSSSIDKIYKYEKWEKQLEDEEAAVDPIVAQEIMDTEPARDAIKNLQLSFSDDKPTEAMFLSIRDFLIARMALENCQRPGLLENATLTDLRRIKKVDNQYVMCISRHKTSQSGPAPITISENLMTNLEAYIKNVRPEFANEDEDHIFVTREGVAFNAGTIGRRITSWWQKATGQNISATQVRKMGSTETMDLPVEEQVCVQAVMTHRRTTAEAYYQINKKTVQAVRGAEALKKKLKTGDSVATLPPGKSDAQAVSTSKDIHSPVSSQESFTEIQLTDIDLLFSDILHTNAALTYNIVRSRMSESINLVEHVKNTKMVQKVYNRIKYLQGKSFQQNLTDAFEFVDEEKQDSHDVRSMATQSTSQVSGPTRRQTWAKADEEHLKRAFSTFDRCPNKETIAAVLSKSDVLQEIRNRNTFNRTYEKVKSIFKKHTK